MDSLPREFALVAACVLLDDAALRRTAPALLKAPGFDWARLEELAFYHEVEQIVRMRLAEVAAGAMPGELAARIRQALMRKSALQAAQTAIAVRLTHALTRAGVPSLLLKGVGLSHMLYDPHPELRTSNDVDIAIAPEHIAAADRAIRQEGLTRTSPVADPPPAARAMFLQMVNVYDYRGPIFNELVELHFRPTLNPYWMPVSFDDLLAATAEIETPQGTVRALDGPLNVHYLCEHAIYNLIDFRLKWFGDIARAVRRAGADDCASYIARFPATLPPEPGRLADEVLHTIAQGVEHAAAQSGAVRAGGEAARIVRRMVRAQGIPVGRSLAQLPLELGLLWLVIRHLPGWRGKARQMLLALADPRDALTLRLGPRFAAVYWLAGPVLSLVRSVQRRRDLPADADAAVEARSFG